MECKFCLAEMDENEKICPACGKSQEEETQEQACAGEEKKIAEEAVAETESAEEVVETSQEETDSETESDEENIDAEPVAEKKKIKAWQLILAIAGGVVLLAVLVLAVLYGLGVNLRAINPFRDNDVYYKASYSATDEKASKKKDIVVATMGEYTLTNSELQIYYWMSADYYIQQYWSYLSMMGYDANKPLDEQVYDEQTGMTYQQLFLETALQEWYKYTTLLDMSKKAGFKLTEEQENYLASLREKLQEAAEEEGFTDLDEFFKDYMFPGSSIDAYTNYNYTGYVGTMYYNSLYENLFPTEAEVEAYYTANEAALKNDGITKDGGNYYNVRHILIAPTGGTTNEDGQTVYSEDAWETCRAAAQKILDEYLAGDKTEDAFAQLAIKNSQDPGSVEDGGLYTMLTKDTNFVEEFKAWYLDESRKPGDTGLVKSVHGYHIMYFSESFPIWKYEVETLILTEKTSKLVKDAQKERPMTVNYKKIVIGDMAEAE